MNPPPLTPEQRDRIVRTISFCRAECDTWATRAELARSAYYFEKAATHGLDADALTAALARLDALEAEHARLREAVGQARSFLFCGQCGGWGWDRACGPGHAAKLAEVGKLLQTIDAALTRTPQEDR